MYFLYADGSSRRFLTAKHLASYLNAHSDRLEGWQVADPNSQELVDAQDWLNTYNEG